MKLKKGMKISKLDIVKGIVTATTKDGIEITLTSSDRRVLTSYKNNTQYVENIQKHFGNKEILENEFSVYKDGKLVFHMK